MNVYAEHKLALEDQLLFRSIVSRLAPLVIDDTISCHVIAKAVQTIYPTLRMKSGRFMYAYEHSWLVTKHNNIIDVYPVAAIGGPLLLDGKVGPWPAAYVEMEDMTWAIEPTVLQNILDRLTKH